MPAEDPDPEQFGELVGAPAIVVQVVDRPCLARARAKELSFVARMGVVLFAILVVNLPRE